MRVVCPAKDACKCLELGNVSQTCSRLDDDERGIILNDTPLASKKCLSYQSPWFVVKDACKCLELKDDAGTICRELDEQDKVTL